MSDSQQKPWSNNPNAPKIPYVLYFQEKANLAGILIASILYGTRKTPPPTRPPTHAHYACLIYHRDNHRVVLPVYGCIAQPRTSQGGAYHVVARILHRGHILVCDHTQRDAAQHPIHFLRR